MAVRASFSRVTRALASQLGQRTSLPRCRQFGVWASPTARDGVKPDSSAASGSASSSSSARSHPYRSEADRRDSRIFGDRDHKALIDEIIRVDHAGEYGAVRIYQGQKDVLQGDKSVAELITEMQATEVEHLETLDVMMAERRARPTALLPLWHVAGYALGAGSALLGKEAAMACTVAVETVIGEHYNDQIRELLQHGYREDELLEVLKRHRDEELDHLNTGLEHDAKQAPMYDAMSSVIKAGCKAAVWVAKRV